jgi:hypothetical protein
MANWKPLSASEKRKNKSQKSKRKKAAPDFPFTPLFFLTFILAPFLADFVMRPSPLPP